MSDTYVQALLHERAGLVAAGRTARVRAVDAELARLGFAVEKAVEKAPETRGRSRSGDRRPVREPG